MNKLKLAERAAAWRERMKVLAVSHSRRSLSRNERGEITMEGVGFGLAVFGGIIALAALFGIIFVSAVTFPLIDAEFMALVGVILIVAGYIVHAGAD
jgi:hypothetical protein